MTLRLALGVVLVVIAGGLSAQEGSTERCRLQFERDPGSGYFVATVPAEQCRDELMARDLRWLSGTHKVGRVFMGSVDLSSSSLDTEVSAGGDRVRRWRIVLPESFEVPASVSTLFPRVVSSEARPPLRIEKCNLQRDTFDLVIHESSAAELQELQIEWIAYEFDPPVTPQSCS